MQQLTTGLAIRNRAEFEQMIPKYPGMAGFLLKDPEAFIRRTSREMSIDLNTSEPTLIRFGEDYGYSGLAEFRIHMALARDTRMSRFFEPAALDRCNANLDAKRRIAGAAVALFAGDSAILIDNGSNAEFYAAALNQAWPKTIMITRLMVARILLAHGEHEVILTGGRIRPNDRSLTGRLVERTLQEMRFGTFGMGADCVDALACDLAARGLRVISALPPGAATPASGTRGT